MYNLELVNAIKDKLIYQQQTVAVAESVTAGHLQAALSLAENASLFFQGGLTAYNLGQKCRHLDIDPVKAGACDSVSMGIAEDMARNICAFFVCDWGIGITGYATTVPEKSINSLFAYFAIFFRKKLILSGKIESEIKNAMDVQVFYTHEVL